MQFTRSACIYAMLPLSLITIFGAQPILAASKRVVPAELYRYVFEAQSKNQEADKKMMSYIRLVSDVVAEFHDRYKRFPQSTEELVQSAPRDNLLGIRNPYLEHEYMSRELPKETSPTVRIEIVEDYGFSKNSITELAKHPPANWDGEPGSIVVMHNSEDLFAIRGCALTRKPVTDSTTGGAACLVTNLSD